MTVDRLSTNSVSALSRALNRDSPRMFTTALDSAKAKGQSHASGLTGSPRADNRDYWHKAISAILAHETRERTVTRGPNGVVVSTHGGDDDVKVEKLDDGRLKVTVKGSWLPVYIDPSEGPLTIDAGDGNDVVTVSANVDQGVTLRGGSGNDYLQCGSGADTIIGGDGYDVAYGLDGDDTIYGGANNDYADGGAGNDKVFGGSGNDVVSGGRGDDWVGGGAGDDVMITAAGHDVADDSGGGDHDLVYAKAGDDVRVNRGSSQVLVEEPGDQLGSSITIRGDPTFVMRMQSDLDTLRYIPVGQQGLASIDASGKHVTIVPAEEIQGGDWSPQWKTEYSLNDANAGIPTDATIGALPSKRSIYDTYGDAQDWRASPPIFALFHEMAHAEDVVYGRLPPKASTSPELGKQVEDSELSATGLPWQQYGDDTADPNTRAVSENSLRRALG